MEGLGLVFARNENGILIDKGEAKGFSFAFITVYLPFSLTGWAKRT